MHCHPSLILASEGGAYISEVPLKRWQHFIELMPIGPYGASSFNLGIDSKSDHFKVCAKREDIEIQPFHDTNLWCKTLNLLFWSINDDQKYFIRMMPTVPCGPSSFYLSIYSKGDHFKIEQNGKMLKYNHSITHNFVITNLRCKNS